MSDKPPADDYQDWADRVIAHLREVGWTDDRIRAALHGIELEDLPQVLREVELSLAVDAAFEDDA